jgi:hypothetical protein
MRRGEEGRGGRKGRVEGKGLRKGKGRKEEKRRKGRGEEFGPPNVRDRSTPMKCYCLIQWCKCDSSLSA